MIILQIITERILIHEAKGSKEPSEAAAGKWCKPIYIHERQYSFNFPYDFQRVWPH